jgi:hypothetical protein
MVRWAVHTSAPHSAALLGSHACKPTLNPSSLIFSGVWRKAFAYRSPFTSAPYPPPLHFSTPHPTPHTPHPTPRHPHFFHSTPRTPHSTPNVTHIPHRTLVAGNLTVRFTSLAGSPGGMGLVGVLEGSLCPGGTFSPTGRPVGTPGVCPGVCPAGYACPAGSTSGTAAVCPAGRYSEAGSALCAVCADWTVSFVGSSQCNYPMEFYLLDG